MKKLRHFKCADCKVSSELLVEDKTVTIQCECKGEAKRMLSAPRCFGNTTGGSPSTNYTKPK